MMDDLISRLSELRCQYNCFDENERDAYHTLSEAIKALSDVPDTNVGDIISRQVAYDTLTAYYHHKTDIQHAALHDALNRVPAARARWEYVDYGGVGNYHCSACRAISPKRTNFCPTCGRDMRGEYQ